MAWLLTAVVVISTAPVMAEPIQAQAEENTSNTKTIAGLGISVIADPIAPASASDAWKGSYVYYGNYNANPIKYRVLDASTTDYSADGTTQTMLLDCDSILYYTPFDNDDTANEDDKNQNGWSISDVKNSLNGDGFLNKEGVFTTAEKNAIAASTVASHALTTDSENGVNVAEWTRNAFVNYVALTGEQIFLLDAEDASNGAYGYSWTGNGCGNRKKAGNGTITVPYTYTDKENATEKEKVNQISVMIADKAYDAEKVANAQEAQILYYGALQDIKNTKGTESTVAESSTGTGIFALPNALTEKKQGEDYHIYLLAEHVNDDNNTDYKSLSMQTMIRMLLY